MGHVTIGRHGLSHCQFGEVCQNYDKPTILVTVEKGEQIIKFAACAEHDAYEAPTFAIVTEEPITYTPVPSTILDAIIESWGDPENLEDEFYDAIGNLINYVSDAAGATPKCPGCGVKFGAVHALGCVLERCSVCGSRRVFCDCAGHNPFLVKWRGSDRPEPLDH